jgi:putative (di)nucleoside polyphosphate hydrolase
MYRPCVGIMLINNQGLVFVGQRLGSGEGSGWQMPQGGIDEGEEIAAAAFRELQEETGVTSAEIIKISDHWYSYDLPLENNVFKGKYRGQKQKWVAFRFTGQDGEIDIAQDNPEFSEWKWAERETLPALIVPFKREVYENVIAEFATCGR